VELIAAEALRRDLAENIRAIKERQPPALVLYDKVRALLDAQDFVCSCAFAHVTYTPFMPTGLDPSSEERRGKHRC
jgi:hypothetical protein